MYRLIRPFLFQLPPEKAHHFALGTLNTICHIKGFKSLLQKYFSGHQTPFEKKIGKLTFRNPIGLAAGFDKNAAYIESMQTLGFGFIEIGTVTPRPQSGNPKPRLFRLQKDGALINRMGFNNDGLAQVIENLKKTKAEVVIGGNIGKNKDTPNEQAEQDYEACFEGLYPYVDYFTVNISSPNTPNLRDLQQKEPLQRIFYTLQNLNQKLGENKPIFVKIAPDISLAQVDEMIETASKMKIDGIIATNTSISREGLMHPKNKLEHIGAGGVSGKPVKSVSTNIIKHIAAHRPEHFFIIGVGGIFSPTDAIEKLQAGADLLQLYTGFIYQGPGLVRNINKAIGKLC